MTGLQTFDQGSPTVHIHRRSSTGGSKNSDTAQKPHVRAGAQP